MDQQLLTRIESPTISAMVNVVSGFKQFVRAIAALPETKQLVKQVRSEDDVRRLIQRIIELSAATHDENYEHPNDTALAIYLWVLNVTQPAAARAVTPVVRECHGCWWAPRLADLLWWHFWGYSQVQVLSDCPISRIKQPVDSETLHHCSWAQGD
jgi:hypothetical protein